MIEAGLQLDPYLVSSFSFFSWPMRFSMAACSDNNHGKCIHTPVRVDGGETNYMVSCVGCFEKSDWRVCRAWESFTLCMHKRYIYISVVKYSTDSHLYSSLIVGKS